MLHLLDFLVESKLELLLKYGVIKFTIFEGIIHILIMLFIQIAVVSRYKKFCTRKNLEANTDLESQSVSYEYKVSTQLIAQFKEIIWKGFYGFVSFAFFINGFTKLAAESDIPYITFWIALGLWGIYYIILCDALKRELREENLCKYSLITHDINFENSQSNATFYDIPFAEIITELTPSLLPEKKIEFNINFPDMSMVKLDITNSKQYFEDVLAIRNSLLPITKKMYSMIKIEDTIPEIENNIKWLLDDDSWKEISYNESEKRLNKILDVLNMMFELSLQWAFFYKEGYSLVKKYIKETSEESYSFSVNQRAWKNSAKRFVHPKLQYYNFEESNLPYSLFECLLTNEQFNFVELSNFFTKCQQRYEEIISKFLKTRYTILAGNKGEALLGKVFDIYRDDEVKFFANVRFEDNFSVENDGLVVTSNGVYSIESKHYGGKIFAEKDGRIMREKYGAYENLQVNAQSNNHIIITERIINEKLKELGIKDKINLIPIIVMTNEAVDIRNESNLTIIRPEMLPNIFRENKDKNFTKKTRDAIIKIIEENKLDLLSYDEIDLSSSLDKLSEFILKQQKNVDIVENEFQQVLEDKDFNGRIQSYFDNYNKQS